MSALEKRFDELDELAAQYGEAEGQRNQLENYKSVVKAKLMKENAGAGVGSYHITAHFCIVRNPHL